MCYGTGMSLFMDENRKFGKAMNRGLSNNRYSKSTPQVTPQVITPTPQETPPTPQATAPTPQVTKPTTPKPTTTSRQNLTIQ